MSDIAIRVENLGKKYQIQHQLEPRRYKTVRDVLAGKIKALLTPARQQSSASREEFWAVKDVSFEIKRGEAVGIIGRNGAGKSTLLKLLSRITEPSTGSIDLTGRVASLLEVGTGFHQELTGRENIYLNGSILGMSHAEVRSKFDEIVAFSEVEKFLDTPVKRYSSGMYMRLAFAVAAHLEPEILIVDEVLAVGDAGFQKKCLGKMGEVSSAGRTVIFVSHQINAIEQLCSRVILMDRGGIKMDSTNPREATRAYLFGDSQDDALPTKWNRTNATFDNEWFSPYRIFIGSENGIPHKMPLPNNSDIWIHIESKVETLDPALTIGIALYAESGELLFWSYQTDSDPLKWPDLKPGNCSIKGHIPQKFMNEGIYRIELIGGLHHRQWLFEPGGKTPAIFLQIQGGLSDSPLWSNKRPGMLAPVLDWKASS